MPRLFRGLAYSDISVEAVDHGRVPSKLQRARLCEARGRCLHWCEFRSSCSTVAKLLRAAPTPSANCLSTRPGAASFCLAFRLCPSLSLLPAAVQCCRYAYSQSVNECGGDHGQVKTPERVTVMQGERQSYDGVTLRDAMPLSSPPRSAYVAPSSKSGSGKQWLESGLTHCPERPLSPLPSLSKSLTADIFHGRGDQSSSSGPMAVVLKPPST